MSAAARGASLRVALSLAIGLGFVALVQAWIGWTTLLRPWSQVGPAPAAAGAGLLLLTHGLRGLRLHDYFGAPVRGQRSACLRLVLRHNVFNNLLPLRSGELAFPMLMARRFAVGPRESIPGLLLFRALDLHAVLLFAVPATLALVLPGALWAALAAAWLALPWAGYRLGRRWARRLGAPGGVIGRTLAQVLAGLPANETVFWRVQAWTLANWGLKLLVFAWILVWFAPLELPHALLGAAGGELTSVLPIHGVAGLGTYEAGAVAALAGSGLSLERLVQAAVNLHLFILSVTLIGGGLALLPEAPRRGGAHNETE